MGTISIILSKTARTIAQWCRGNLIRRQPFYRILQILQELQAQARVEEECRTVVIKTATRQMCSLCMRLLEITMNSAMKFNSDMTLNTSGIIDFYTYFSNWKLLLDARGWSQRPILSFCCDFSRAGDAFPEMEIHRHSVDARPNMNVYFIGQQGLGIFWF